MKKCNKCGIEKELTYFYSQEKVNKNGVKYIYYRPDCKECTKKSSHEWQTNHPEQRKELLHRYNTSDKGRKHFYEYGINYRRDGRRKEWEQNNKDKRKEYREERMVNKNHVISDDELKELYKYANHSCMYCGISEKEHKELHNQRLHRDHAINEGSNGIDNCILSCKNCNSAKHDKDWFEWYTPNNQKYTNDRYMKICSWLNN
jgi:hypothetical protein